MPASNKPMRWLNTTYRNALHMGTSMINSNQQYIEKWAPLQKHYLTQRCYLTSLNSLQAQTVQRAVWWPHVQRTPKTIRIQFTDRTAHTLHCTFHGLPPSPTLSPPSLPHSPPPSFPLLLFLFPFLFFSFSLYSLCLFIIFILYLTVSSYFIHIYATLQATAAILLIAHHICGPIFLD